MPHQAVLEIAVQDVAGIRIACDVGAARAELCVALGATGGLTPSVGLVELAVAAAQSAASARPGLAPLEVHVLIRPRAGGFVYDDDEVAVAVRDIQAVLAAGASGVVVGALTPAGGIDVGALSAFRQAAGGAPVTFHRAIDIVDDVLGAVDVLVAAGVTRVLTSGGAARSVDGLARLAAMSVRAAGRLEIMAGGGVRPEDVGALVGAGVAAVHLSAKGFVVDAAGVGGGSGTGYEVTDGSLARRAAQALGAAGIRA